MIIWVIVTIIIIIVLYIILKKMNKPKSYKPKKSLKQRLIECCTHRQ